MVLLSVRIDIHAELLMQNSNHSLDRWCLRNDPNYVLVCVIILICFFVFSSNEANDIFNHIRHEMDWPLKFGNILIISNAKEDRSHGITSPCYHLGNYKPWNYLLHMFFISNSSDVPWIIFTSSLSTSFSQNHNFHTKRIGGVYSC